MHTSDWYFDFISPYAYFGLLRFEELGELAINYHPVLLAELLKQCGQKGPAEIPAKRLWTYRACVWWAAKNQIPFRFPAVDPFNPLPYLRLAIAADCAPKAIKQIFEAIWTTGDDPNDPAVLAKLARTIGVELAQLSSQAVKDSLRLETEKALAHGVFGVPTHRLDQQLFWGADATDFVKAYLDDASVLNSDEMQRVATLPIGEIRKSA